MTRRKNTAYNETPMKGPKMNRKARIKKHIQNHDAQYTVVACNIATYAVGLAGMVVAMKMIEAKHFIS